MILVCPFQFFVNPFHFDGNPFFALQVGCAFQCAFCATGKVGLKRQLDADEITDQALLRGGTGWFSNPQSSPWYHGCFNTKM
jgi:hypothetical protein